MEYSDKRHCTLCGTVFGRLCWGQANNVICNKNLDILLFIRSVKLCGQEEWKKCSYITQRKDPVHTLANALGSAGDLCKGPEKVHALARLWRRSGGRAGTSYKYDVSRFLKLTLLWRTTFDLLNYNRTLSGTTVRRIQGRPHILGYIKSPKNAYRSQLHRQKEIPNSLNILDWGGAKG